MEERIKQWMDKYSIEEILEVNDLTPEQALGILIELGLLNDDLLDNGHDGQGNDEEAGETPPSSEHVGKATSNE